MSHFLSTLKIIFRCILVASVADNLFCESNCSFLVVHFLFWLLLRFSLLSVQALCKAHSKTELEIQRISWEKWIKGHGSRSRWQKLSNHNTDLMLQKAFGVGRGSLQGNSESLGQACRDLLNWRSLALDRKGSSVVPTSWPTLAESQLGRAWPPTDHCCRA